MFEIIVGLACLPIALVVGFYLVAIGVGAIFYLGGWLLAAFGLLLMFGGATGPAGFICLFVGGSWGFWSAKVAKQ